MELKFEDVDLSTVPTSELRAELETFLDAYSIDSTSVATITLVNFRAFRGQHTFDFEGKNALIYGENGSGKTSLWSAIDLFFASSYAESKESNSTAFEKQRYQHTDEDGEVRVTFQEDGVETSPFVWSKEESPYVVEGVFLSARVRACLDYRALWETYFLHRKENQVDIWPLLIETLMPNTKIGASGETYEDAWLFVNSIKPLPARLTQGRQEAIRYAVSLFDKFLVEGLKEIREETASILNVLSPGLELHWDILAPQLDQIEGSKQWQIFPPKVVVQVKLNDRWLKNHHNLLNEARLSALALSIYLAAAKINALQARDVVKVLALDDVLIGLDMSNRMPVLDVLEQWFGDWQIFLFTYDRVWYELAKARLDGEKWKKFEVFASDDVPVWNEDLEGLDKAREYLKTSRRFAGLEGAVNVTPDYRAAGIYARTSFEILLKRFFQKHKVPVPFQLEAKQMLGDLWPIMETLESDTTVDEVTTRALILSAAFRRDMEIYKNNSLNPLCHSGFFQCERREVEKAVAAVETLQTELSKAHKRVGLPELQAAVVPSATVDWKTVDLSALSQSELGQLKGNVQKQLEANGRAQNEPR